MYFKERRQGFSRWRFELAHVVMALALSILGFRVLSHVCEKKENYKKLPISAKEESRAEEPAHVKKNRELFVASNSKLTLFILLFLTGVLVVEINVWLTAMVVIGSMAATLLTLITKSLCNVRSFRSALNLKRFIIFFVAVLIGGAFINS